MRDIRMVARALSPVVINEQRQSSNNVSLDYIPGSTLRGALASAYLRRGNPEDDAFKALFLGDAAIPDLLPTDSVEAPSRVLPLTAFSCKRNPGFRSRLVAGSEPGHGVRDMLALLAVGRLGTAAEAGGVEASADWDCVCRQELKPFAGYWNGDLKAPALFRAEKSYNRFTGVDRLTRTVAQSIFYTSQSLDDYNDAGGSDPSRYFCGTARVDAAGYASLAGLAAEPLFVGSDRTRGYGELELALSEIPPAVPDYEAWDRDFRGLLGASAGTGFYFSVTLASHAILLDRFLRPSAQLDTGIDGCEEIMRLVKGVQVRGWSAAWGLPKPDDAGLRKGSTFLLRYQGSDSAGLMEQLERLRREGVGVRKEEGFGSVIIDDPIHTIKEAL